MSFTKQELEQMAEAVPMWFDSVDLGQGAVSKGWKSPSDLAYELRELSPGGAARGGSEVVRYRAMAHAWK